MSYLLTVLFCILFSLCYKVIDGTSYLKSALSYLLAAPLSIAISCYCFYISLITQQNILLILVAPILLLVIYLVNAGIRPGDIIQFPELPSKFHLIVALVAFLVLCIRISGKFSRWGDWDAWAIWNLHAKFLNSADYWQNMFSDALLGSHPDYPLMLPSLVALVWKAVASQSPLVPIAIAHIIFVLLVCTMYCGLRRYGSIAVAVLSFIVLVFSSKFVQIAASQYADTLLGYFLLVTFIIGCEVSKTKSHQMALILGIVSSSLTWIKNEGILFFLAFSFIFLISNFKNKRIGIGYIFGTLLPIAVLIHFKFELAPANDLINHDRGNGYVSLIFDSNRYLIILKSFFQVSIRYYWILFVFTAILILRKVEFLQSPPFIVIYLILAGFFTIYLTTPNDLQWHLDASLDRVFHQIFPSCLYLVLAKLENGKRAATDNPL